MRTVVVYESHWGNTAAIARAVAEGIGSDSHALTTTEASPEMIVPVDLIVAGAPLLGFALPTEAMLQSLSANASSHSQPPDLSHPSLRSWLQTLASGTCKVAAFETKIWWSPGSAAKTILKLLKAKGYQVLTAPQQFIVRGKYGPLKEGEIERAMQWGKTIAALVDQL